MKKLFMISLLLFMSFIFFNACNNDTTLVSNNYTNQIDAPKVSTVTVIIKDRVLLYTDPMYTNFSGVHDMNLGEIIVGNPTEGSGTTFSYKNKGTVLLNDAMYFYWHNVSDNRCKYLYEINAYWMNIPSTSYFHTYCLDGTTHRGQKTWTFSAGTGNLNELFYITDFVNPTSSPRDMVLNGDWDYTP